MKHTFFIYPNPNKNTPRGIRILNIVEELKLNEPNQKFEILSFNKWLENPPTNLIKTNCFNLYFHLYRYLGVFKFGGAFYKKSKILDSFIFIHSFIKFDLIRRISKINAKDCVFVVVVSPFSNYLLVPWLRRKFPEARIICDIGDPLYKNTARWNDDNFSKSIEADAIKNSDAIIVTNTITKKHFCGEFNYSSNKIFVIPQGVNIQMISEQSNLTEIKIGTIAYAGRFYKDLRSPDELYRYIQSQDYYRFNVYGKNNNESQMNNIKFHGAFEQFSLFKKIQENEVLVFIDNKYGVQTSGKIFELLAFKKPILFIKGDEETLTLNLAKKFENVFFADNNCESIRNALIQYENSKNKGVIDYNIQEFSWNTRGKKYLKLLRNEA